MHVFLSYAREDRERARIVASALEAEGWSVWWDRKLAAGQIFDRTIEEQLDIAVAVVVLWSASSVQSEWVRNEAGAANDRGLLVPAVLDDVPLPLEFRRRHTANLSGWQGDRADAEFRTLTQGLIAKRDSHLPSHEVQRAPPAAVSAASVRQPAAPAKHHNAASPPGAARWRFAPTPYVVSALAIAAILTAWLASRSFGPPSDDTTQGGGEWRTSELAPAAGRSADAPAPLPIDTIMKTRLRPHEAAYFQLPEPVEAFDIVVDLRLVDNVRSHLGATVSVLDPNGAIIRDSLVWIGGTAYGRTARQTASYGAGKPARLGFKVANGSNPTDIWVTVRPARAAGLVPFFGEIVAEPLRLGQPHKGQLGFNQEAYYQATLPIGAYDAILEFARVTVDAGQIFGVLGKSSSDGGGWAQLLYFQDYGRSFRKSARFAVSEAGAVVFTMVNTVDAVDYIFRVQPADSDIP